MGGQVVRAARGERDQYRPIVSSLCASSDPLAITQALLELYPFSTMYIADLDAIMGRHTNINVISQLKHHFPKIEFWVDAGIGQIEQAHAIKALGVTFVFGSERLNSYQQYQAIQTGDNNEVLSLDFGPTGFLGDPQILEGYKAWPRRVICMTMSKVGSYEGVDWDKISDILKRAGPCKIFAAGGVRSIADLRTLASKKLAGALVASVLHDGKISQIELAALMR